MSRQRSRVLDYGSSLAGDEHAQGLMARTDRVFEDAENLRRVVAQYENCDTSFVQGRAFEFMEVLKFNRAAFDAHSDLRAEATHFFAPKSPVDVHILRMGEVVREVQAGSYGDTKGDVARVIRKFAADKYEGMMRLTPVDRVDGIRGRLGKWLEEWSEERLGRVGYEDALGNLNGTLAHGGVDTGGTTRAAAEFAAENPALTEAAFKAEGSIQEVGQAIVVGAAFAAVSHAIFRRFRREDDEQSVVGLEVAGAGRSLGMMSTVGTAAARSALARTISLAARYTGESPLLAEFGGSHGPGVIATALWESGVAMREWTRGDIEVDECRQRVGGACLRSSLGYGMGLAGQAIIPIPIVGYLVGSVAGYTAATVMAEAGLLALGEGGIEGARERRREVERWCAQSIAALHHQRRALDYLAQEWELSFVRPMNEAISLLAQASERGDIEDAVLALSSINGVVGTSLPWRTFAEFDKFMLDPETTLLL